MKKKNKKLVGVFLVALVIISILAFTGVLKIPGLALGGFTNLAISKVTIDGKDFIKVYGTAQGYEGLSVTLTQSELDKSLSQYGLKSTKPIPITIKLEKQTAKFSISKTSSETFYNVKYKDRGRLTSCSVSSCQNELGSSIKVIGISRSPTLVCMCVYIEQEGITGKFINDRSIDYSVSINVDGNIQDLTRDQNELSFNNNKIKVSGFGSLNNFDEINAPTSWYALFTNSKYSKLISTSAYNSQENNFKEFKSCMGYSTSASFWDVAKSPLSYLLSSIKSVGSVSTCVNNYRNKVNSYLFDQMDSYKSSKVSYYADSSDIYFEGDNLVINLKTPSVYPTFTIEMEAESVGIIKLKGKPKCENPKDVTINSGTSLTEMIRVTNIGEADGSFSGSVSCNGEVSGTISESYFEKGETKDMRISISASNTNQGTFNSNCVYTIKDRGSGETTTCSNTINVKYQSGIVCTPPGSFSCEGDNLMKCSSEGTEKLLEKVCPSGCLNNYCVGEIKNDTTSSTDCKSCSQWLMNIFKSKEKECSSTSAFKPDVKWYNPFSWTTWTSVKLLDLTGLTSQKYICPLYFLLLFVFVMILILVMALIGIPVGIFFFIFTKIFKNLKSGIKKAKKRR